LVFSSFFFKLKVYTNRIGVECSKPYNPILGEVFQCSWKHADGSTTEFISEQVSHHPPKSAFRSINKERKILFEGWYEPSTSFKMNYITFEFSGNFTLTLLDTKEVYQITFPNTSACGLLWGKSYYELGGKLIIEKNEGGDKLEMNIDVRE
jgi:oxysterol-binding protein-related protein 8